MAKHAQREGASGRGRGRRGFWTFVMWLALAIFVVAVGYLGTVFYSYWNDAQRYDEVADKVFNPKGDTLADMTVDWDELRKINPEIVAWVYVPDSPISYPVCYSGDNVKYLDVNFDNAAGVFTGSGAIFLDGEAKRDFSSPCNFLFGHHMNDGSMFACLSGFAAEEEFEAHRTVYLLTPAMNYEYKSFAIVRTVGTDTLMVHSFADKEARDAYILDKQERSLVTPKEGFVTPAETGKLLALSTCDYNEADGRAILFTSLKDSAVPSASGTVVGDADGYSAPASEG